MLLPNLSKDQISLLSKIIVFNCFRNRPISDIHDVQNGGTRITETEMKEIMEYAVTELARFMDGLISERGPYFSEDHWKRCPILKIWNEPDWSYIEAKNSIE